MLIKKLSLRFILFIFIFLFYLFFPQSSLAEETLCYACDSSIAVGPGVVNGKICLISNTYLEAADLVAYRNCQNIDCSESPACSQANQVTWPKLKLNVPIPGLEELSQPEGVVVNEYVLTKYIGGIYKFFVGIAAILAVFMIVFGGTMWIFSGGSSEAITKAKETIIGAIAGLILAVGSYSILYSINPALVEFKGLPLPPIPFMSYPELISVSEQAQQAVGVSTGDACPSENMVVDASDLEAHPNITLSNVYDKRLTPETKQKLITAANSLGAYEWLIVTSMYRDLEYQKYLYECYQKSVGLNKCTAGCTSCNLAAKPYCSSPHLEGVAVDVCISRGTKSTCGYLRQSCNGGACGGYPQLANDQLYLQQKMQAAGFTRFCGEWWHFESTPKSKTCGPGVYN